MAKKTRYRLRADHHRTYGEEVALLLSLVIVIVLGMALSTLLILEFLNVLPSGMSSVMILSLLVFIAVIGNAVFERAVALPSVYRSVIPVFRSGGSR
jgi:hypothetical protein